MYLNGHLLARDLTYQVQLAVADRDYRDGAKSPVYDAYLDYRAHRDLQVRAGQFFVPFDRLRTIREYALHLAADAVFKWEGLAIQGEYLWKRSATDVIVSTNSDGSTKKEPTRSAYGWVAQASYVFETPYEVVARASRMTAISGTDPWVRSGFARARAGVCLRREPLPQRPPIQTSGDVDRAHAARRGLHEG